MQECAAGTATSDEEAGIEGSPLMLLVGTDTETVHGRPWCVQWSTSPGMARMVMAADAVGISHLRTLLQRPDVLVSMHNAMFDLGVLRELGIEPVNWTDTMVMAYLLQDEPLGLKALAFRHCNMRMQSYREVVRPASERLAFDYLGRVLQRTWPAPTPLDVLQPDGTIKQKKRQGIDKRILRAIGDYSKGDRVVDLRDRWEQMGKDLPELTCLVEQEFGPMEEGALSDIPFPDAVSYACRDADAQWGVHCALWPRIVAQGLESALSRDLGCQRMVVDMMHNGIKADRARFTELSSIFLLRMDEAQAAVDRVAGHHVNIASPPQVLAFLREQGIAGPSVTSTAAEELDALKLEHPIVGRLQDWRTYSKYRSTYVDALPRMIGPDGRIHSDFTMTATDTGRLSSRHPNLMNQPVRDEEGKEIRSCFVAEDGHVLLCADYSQIEMRLLAHCSGDQSMISAFQRGEDIHAATGAAMFHHPPNKMERYAAKRTGFGTVYGITPQGLLELFIGEGIYDFSLDDCAAFIDSWFSARPGAAAWIEETMQRARIDGFVSDIFGRRRWVPECQSSIPWVRDAGLRKAVNAPIQMSAASIIKEAMCSLTPIYLGYGNQLLPLIQVHDELVFEVAENVLDEVEELVRTVMERAVTLTVPVLVDSEVGRDWKNVTDYTEWKKEAA